MSGDLHRRGVADDLLGELQAVALVAEHLADAPLGGLQAVAGRHAAVDVDRGARRDDVELVRGVGHRRREGDPEHRLDEHPEHGVALAQALQGGAGSPFSGPNPSPSSSARGPSVRSKPGWRSPMACSSGATFRSALSPILGIEAWPAVPSVVRRKRKTPFSATQTPKTRRSS
jgi:hypothetical protein